jgi:L-alanine-DL-glutamate epimerase-like enolase superfamily enzyme
MGDAQHGGYHGWESTLRIDRIELSVFTLPSNTPRFQLDEVSLADGRRRWVRKPVRNQDDEIHVLHVCTDDGLRGDCTVGDARYTTLREDELDYLRILTIGEDADNRGRLCEKLHAAARGMFTQPGWYGAFDNCLWDIAGKAAGRPVCDLIGRVRPACSAYYNFGGATPEAAGEDARRAVGMGYRAVKDHFRGTGAENEAWFRAVREAVGPEIDVLHDAAGCDYSLQEAIRVARVLEELQFVWFEEPLSDRDLTGLRKLCDAVSIPILAPETLMHDHELSREWLLLRATDKLRVNARHGMTRVLELAQIAEQQGTTIEANGPGGNFGLVHAHLVCAVENTTYYEFFPGGSRDEVGKEIGLMNPPVPVAGSIAPPGGAGWGAEWDWAYFESKRVGVL